MFDSLDTLSDFAPAAGEVHVWCVPLDAVARRIVSPGSDRSEYRTGYLALSEDERDRISRLIRSEDRARYAVARGVLRRLLSGYLDIAPADIRFAYGAFGKPELAGRQAERLRFNLSHAGAWAVYALARDRCVGIDIEPLSNDFPWQDLAPLVFSTNELAELGGIRTCEKAAAFIRGWTRKEAYVKGRGEGLSMPLKSFDIPLRTFESPTSVGIHTVRGLPTGWRLYPLELIPGYASALVVEGNPVRIAVYRWTGQTAWTQPPIIRPNTESKTDTAFSVAAGVGRSNTHARHYHSRYLTENAWRI